MPGQGESQEGRGAVKPVSPGRNWLSWVGFEDLNAGLPV